jgi:hypothetical protein
MLPQGQSKQVNPQLTERMNLGQNKKKSELIEYKKNLIIKEIANYINSSFLCFCI